MLIKHTLGKYFYEIFPELINCDFYKIVRFLEKYYTFRSEKPIITEFGNSIIVELAIETIEHELFILKRLNHRFETEKATEVLMAS